MSAPYADLQPPVWVVKVLSNLAGGINVAAPEHEIADEETPNSENLRFTYGRSVVDSGYAKVGTNTMRGVVKGLFTHQRANGITTTLAVTDLSVYEFVISQSAWHYVRSALDTTLTVAKVAGNTSINVANTAGFAVGNFIGIVLNNGGQHQTTIAAIPTPGAPGVITIATGLPSAAGIGNLFLKAVVLAGNDDHQVVFAAVPSHEWTVFTNGVDIPMRYDGTDCRVIPNLPSGGDVRCRTLVVYRDAYLVLGNLIEAGVPAPFKLMWCSSGDPTNWTTGDSGNNSLMDSRDAIVALKPLVGALIVYRSSSIVIQEFVGLPFRTFIWTPINFGRSIAEEGVGCISPNGVFAFTDVHLVMGRNRIYAYRGGDRTDTISQKVARKLFGSGGAFPREGLIRAFTFYDETNDEIYFGSPSSGMFPTLFAIIDTVTGRWRFRRTGHEITCAGVRPVTATEIVRIIDLVGSIAMQSWIIGGGGVPEGAAIIMLGQFKTAGNGNVVDYNLIASSDDGVPIAWFHETKAFRAYDRFAKCTFVELEISGPSSSLRRWKGSSGTFVQILAIPTSGAMRRVRAHKQFVEETVKFRIQGSGSGAELGVLVFKYRPESRWSL